MSVGMRARQPAVIVRQSEPVYNEYGEEISSGGESRTEVRAVRIGPTSAREYSQGRQTLVTALVGIWPPGTDIRETDVVEVASLGATLQVTGMFKVPDARNPEKIHHIHTTLESVS